MLTYEAKGKPFEVIDEIRDHLKTLLKEDGKECEDIVLKPSTFF